jgi:hypothetical protein
MAEMVSGFAVLCVPAIPKLFSESPWIRKVMTTIKSFTRESTSKRTSPTKPDIAPFHNPMPRKGSMSLFTDTIGLDTLPLTDISIISECSVTSDPIEMNGKPEGSHSRVDCNYSLPG